MALRPEDLAPGARADHATDHRSGEIPGNARAARPVLRTSAAVRSDKTVADLRKRLRKATGRATGPQGGLGAVAANPCYGNVEPSTQSSCPGQCRIAALPVSGPWLERLRRHRGRNGIPGAVT
ncbi:hypothetical protein ACFU6R_00335 [Streptomyces sp. NPDC057499]|uniref:hypothetical protein n=1 Tax=Streptomyces sp. NPDC057499 TaxID=3346150 RepID=UPI0036AC574F